METEASLETPRSTSQQDTSGLLPGCLTCDTADSSAGADVIITFREVTSEDMLGRSAAVRLPTVPRSASADSNSRDSADADVSIALRQLGEVGSSSVSSEESGKRQVPGTEQDATESMEGCSIGRAKGAVEGGEEEGEGRCLGVELGGVEEASLEGAEEGKVGGLLQSGFIERRKFDLKVVNLTYKVLTRERAPEDDNKEASKEGGGPRRKHPRSCLPLSICAPASNKITRTQSQSDTVILNNDSGSCAGSCAIWGGMTSMASRLLSRKRREKVLLWQVNAEARHGEILAVVGPSGAGKSTFLDAVAGRIRKSSLEGDILLNGGPVDSSFRRVSGYVVQEDQLFPMLTVRETLMFSARLRIPNTMTKTQKAARVEAVIQELGLTSCADTTVGNEQIRGVSGGERRRTSIGVDLIHDPAVLFLDEPTSGLDSVAAYSVVQILRQLAEGSQRTIILTIHQPAFRILELIHNFLVLSKGFVVYHGPYHGLARHFRAFAGDPEACREANALEYALDVVERAQKTDEELRSLIDYTNMQKDVENPRIQPSKIGSRRRKAKKGVRTEDDPRYATGFLSELGVLVDRSFKNILRTRELFLTRVFLFLFASVIVGSIFYDSPYTAEGVRNRESFFAFALMAFLFTAIEALPVFLEERQIFVRETSRGAYRTASYVVAGTLAAIPFLFVTAVAGSIISYFMVGLAMSAEAFFTFLAASFITLAVGDSFVLFVGGFVPNFAIGVTVSTAVIAFYFLCSGFFIASSRIPKYWIWLNWLSTFKYPLKMMMLNEFGALPNVCWEASPHLPSPRSTVGLLSSRDPGSSPYPYLPPGVELPAGFTIPPGFTMPPGFSGDLRALAPPGYELPSDLAGAPGTSSYSAVNSGGIRHVAPPPPVTSAGVGSPQNPCLLTSQLVLQSQEMGDTSIWANALVMLAFFVGYRLLFFILLKMHSRKVRR